jgi:hypothetical protein
MTFLHKLIIHFYWLILMETNVVVIVEDDSRQDAAEQIGRGSKVIDIWKKKFVLD